MRPGRNGGSLRVGSRKGEHLGNGGGRPPEALRVRCARELQDEKWWKGIRAIRDNPDHPKFMAAVEFLANRAEGAPRQPIEMSGAEDEGIKIIVESA